jgi:hypothetical protein
VAQHTDMTVAQLHEALKGKGVDGMWDMNKAELLEFLYQDRRKDGRQSNFFRLLRPQGEG